MFFGSCLLLCLLAGTELSAQKVIVNDSNEKIIIFPDGSWRYYDESKDQIPAEPKNEEPSPDPIKQKERDRKETKRKKKKTKQRKSSHRYGVELPYEEQLAQQQAVERAEEAAVAELKANDALKEARINRIVKQEELRLANEDVETGLEEVEKLEKALAEAKVLEEAAKSRKKAAEKYTRLCQKMIDMPKKKRDKLLAKLDATNTSDMGTLSLSQSERSEESGLSGNSKKSASYRNVMTDPPRPDCDIAFEGVDEFSGKRRRDMAPQLLFTHTSEQLAPYMKERNYISCEGFISSSSGGFRYLTLQITIASELAQREFGVLEKGAPITIRFLDGSTTRLYTNVTEIGIVNPVDRLTQYTTTYTITSGAEKQLRKKEVDKIRMQWGTGYEDYEVYELDFFSDQLRCLNIK